jgi:release factor glutamine methyltransferase
MSQRVGKSAGSPACQHALQPRIADSLNEARIRLARLTATPALDAQTLLAHLTGRNRASLLAHPQATLSPRQHEQFQAALIQLESGLPLPYLLGEWEFYGRPFTLTPDVLIPRPETELLVETAIKLFNHPERRNTAGLPQPKDIADIGTGSGILAVTLALELPAARLTASDLSPAALAVAQQNAARHHVTHRITFIHANLLNFQSSTFDLIISNLPYIPTATLRELPIYGREPTLALDGGADGLRLIDRLLQQAGDRLAPGGAILLEIESSQGASAPRLARRHFPTAEISLQPDLAGHPRLLLIQT